MNTITTPDFMGRVAKIVEEIRNRACVDKLAVEVITEILQASLHEYYTMLNEYYAEEYTMLNEYYEEEFYIAVSSARSKAYDDGHSDGYADGYDVGYDDGYSKNHSVV